MKYKDLIVNQRQLSSDFLIRWLDNRHAGWRNLTIKLIFRYRYCETQRFTDQKLSSTIFTCCPVPSRIRYISIYANIYRF